MSICDIVYFSRAPSNIFNVIPVVYSFIDFISSIRCVYFDDIDFDPTQGRMWLELHYPIIDTSNICYNGWRIIAKCNSYSSYTFRVALLFRLRCRGEMYLVVLEFIYMIGDVMSFLYARNVYFRR